MKETITKKSIIHIGFESEDGIVFRYDIFSVRLKKGEPENPQIEMLINFNRVFFPGAYTLKDLKDLMFFYYGENEYGNRFAHLPIEIIG